jgi:hypothetical protein
METALAGRASKFVVTGKRLLKRIAFTLALSCGLFIFLAAIDAHATPIRPDIRKLVTEPQQDSTARFLPARAGWQGPEMPRQQALNPALQGFDAASYARAWRAAFWAAATPEPTAVLGIVGVIFLLRTLRAREQKRAGRRSLVMPEPAKKPDRLAA